MSNELEPFRRAAVLGCKDIIRKVSESKGIYIVALASPDGKGCWHLPHEYPKINRYAAAVCAEWWAEIGRKRGSEAEKIVLVHTSERMIDLCREFARKHGGTQ